MHLVSPEEQIFPLSKDNLGYHQAVIEGIVPGCRYYYRLDSEKEHPDPASRFQPHGVHGPSEVVASYFSREDQGWSGLPLEEYIIYELHVGIFTREGTFDAIIPYLDGLKELGVTAIELMPVAQFPGSRNWGYDGVYPFAVQDSYGGPEGLRRLVNACHLQGLAIILDVLYNHFGPEGNYLADFGPYFTQRYQTPWGAALNLDGPDSDEVRRFFIENAVYWLTEFHIDALRLDALHSILDTSSYPFIEELAVRFHEQAEKLNLRAYLIGESAANDARLVMAPESGGYGLDAQWNDDFHHALHVLLTDEQNGYYQDFGGLEHLVKALKEGFVYSGQYSQYRQRRHGVTSKNIPASSFVVFAQNHDQVGNRLKSERLSQLIPFEELKLAAGVVLLSPFIPLLFMGEEYGEEAPFAYFVNHSEPALIEAVRRGRRDEFALFEWSGEIPDPQDETTFMSAKLDHSLGGQGWHHTLFDFYKELIQLRKDTPALARLNKNTMAVRGFEDKLLVVNRWSDGNEVVLVFNLSQDQSSATIPMSAGRWFKRLDSAEKRWQGEGSAIPEQLDTNGQVSLNLNPWTFALFIKET
jgi:maltooligosyltrehalose trehalohydrolase